ncbi:MAG: hypothetical protein IPG03_13390 [Candidatus Microthrix sp.]|nr:hypothetical protein [Candidatus Microthrix sp.]
MSEPPDPALASPRPDLDFLRHRSVRPKPAPRLITVVLPPRRRSKSPSNAAPTSTPNAPTDPAPAPAPEPHPPTPTAPSIDLDLSSPTPPPQPTQPVATPPSAPPLLSIDLDLSSTTPTESAAATPGAPAPPSAPPSATGSSAQPDDRRWRPLPVRSARRVANDVAARLTSTAPTVTLTRIQSGTGALDGQVVAPPGVGRLSLGCVVQLDNGATYAVHCIGGQATPRLMR